MNKILLLLCLFLTTVLYAQGRGPAIEPGRGISIDQYDHSVNKNDPGFNWKNSNKGRTAETTIPLTKTYRKKASTSDTSSAWANLLLTALVLTLPILIWFTVLRRVGDAETSTAESVVNLNQYRNDQQSDLEESEDHDHDDHFPKAS